MERDGSLVKSVNDGLKWVRERDDFVFITDGPPLRYLGNQPPCDLKVGMYRCTENPNMCTNLST